MRKAAFKLELSSPLRFLTLLLAGTVVLIAGLVLIGFLIPNAVVGASKLIGASSGALAARGYLVMTWEALAYTIGPIEITRRLWGRLLPGALVGAIVYVVGVHWDNGWRGLAAAAWIVAVVSGGYLLERTRSLPWAAALAIALKLAFWTAALAALAA